MTSITITDPALVAQLATTPSGVLAFCEPSGAEILRGVWTNKTNGPPPSSDATPDSEVGGDQ